MINKKQQKINIYIKNKDKNILDIVNKLKDIKGVERVAFKYNQQ